MFPRELQCVDSKGERDHLLHRLMTAFGEILCVSGERMLKMCMAKGSKYVGMPVAYAAISADCGYVCRLPEMG